MKLSKFKLGMIAAGVLLAHGAMADHNSPWGAGWANMPNDIHNTRIDTLGDRDTFRDFVRYGNGADSVNRFSTDTARRGGQRMSGGMGSGMGGGRGR